jgi:hypothetical protein
VTSNLSAIQRGIARAVSTRREIQAAYVFGSAVTGRTRPDSDLDVAVLLGKRLDPHRALDYRLKLMSDLGAALRRSDVELVILDDAAPLLAHRVLSQGTLVFERSRSARVRFQVRIAALYADLVPLLETQIRYLKKHARARRVGG